jgi:hypothetical protein
MRSRRVFRWPAELADHHEVLTAGQPRIEGRPFDERPNLRQHLGVGGRHGFAEDAIDAGGRPDQAEQHTDRRGLP